VAGSCEHGDEPSSSTNAGNVSSSSQTIGFSGSTLFRGIKELVVFEADTDISSTGCLLPPTRLHVVTTQRTRFEHRSARHVPSLLDCPTSLIHVAMQPSTVELGDTAMKGGILLSYKRVAL
jgi:hypothetical protein